MSDATDKREFARIPVRIGVRFRIVRGQDAEELERELHVRPSVWAPPGESELLKLATRTGSGSEGLFAQALLDLSGQVRRLTQHVLAGSGPAAVGEFRLLSASGGLLWSATPLAEGSRLDLRLADEDPEAPPVRMLAEVLRPTATGPEALVPLRILSIHPADQERMIRCLHALQRRHLREAAHRT